MNLLDNQHMFLNEVSFKLDPNQIFKFDRKLSTQGDFERNWKWFSAKNGTKSASPFNFLTKKARLFKILFKIFFRYKRRFIKTRVVIKVYWFLPRSHLKITPLFSFTQFAHFCSEGTTGQDWSWSKSKSQRNWNLQQLAYFIFI